MTSAQIVFGRRKPCARSSLPPFLFSRRGADAVRLTWEDIAKVRGQVGPQ